MRVSLTYPISLSSSLSPSGGTPPAPSRGCAPPSPSSSSLSFAMAPQQRGSRRGQMHHLLPRDRTSPLQWWCGRSGQGADLRRQSGGTHAAADSASGGTGTTRAAVIGLNTGPWMGSCSGSSAFLYVFFILLTQAGNCPPLVVFVYEGVFLKADRLPASENPPGKLIM